MAGKEAMYLMRNLNVKNGGLLDAGLGLGVKSLPQKTLMAFM